MKLSIVSPAYNVGQYLPNYFNSIFSQNIDVDHLEVILVDDGSTDNTKEVVEDYINKYPNFIYIYQENQGQSVARNNGLKRATGDLIWYVDSDDEVSENSIKTIFSYFEKYPSSDFLIFDSIRNELDTGNISYRKSWRYTSINFLKKPINFYDVPLGRKGNSILLACVPWLFIFKRSYLINNELFFTPKILHEDDEIRMRIFFFVKEMHFIKYAHYRYSANRPGSLTTTHDERMIANINSSLLTINNWKLFESKYAINKIDHIYINSFINYQYSQILLNRTNNNDNIQQLFKTKLKEWKSDYIKSFSKSFSISDFSFVKIVRFLVVLFCPNYYEYTKFTVLRNKFKSFLHK